MNNESYCPQIDIYYIVIKNYWKNSGDQLDVEDL